jgi:uncharacterized protein RhaS with RHS repeats
MNNKIAVNEENELKKSKTKKIEQWGNDYFICPWCHEESDGVIEVYWTVDRFNRKEKVAYITYFDIKNWELWDGDYVKMGNRKEGFYCLKCKKRVILPEEIEKLFA